MTVKTRELRIIEAKLRAKQIKEKESKLNTFKSGAVKPQWHNEKKLYEKGFWNKTK